MSRPDEEELVDYDEAAEEIIAPPPAAAATNGAKADGDKKGSYVGIHSTGFRCVSFSDLYACTRLIKFQSQRLPSQARAPPCYL